MYVACAQTVALPFGIYAGRQKSRLLLACYISVVVLIIFMLIVCCVLGWTAAFFQWHPTRCVYVPVTNTLLVL